MKIFFTTIMVLLLIQSSQATSIASKPLAELVASADHVLVVNIVYVTMIDGAGELITDPEARTGPGMLNTLRLHVKIKENGVLKTNSEALPDLITVPLWSKWHHTLRQVRADKGNDLIVLLKGTNFRPVYPALFRQPLNKKHIIIELIEQPDNQSNVLRPPKL